MPSVPPFPGSSALQPSQRVDALLQAWPHMRAPSFAIPLSVLRARLLEAIHDPTEWMTPVGGHGRSGPLARLVLLPPFPETNGRITTHPTEWNWSPDPDRAAEGLALLGAMGCPWTAHTIQQARLSQTVDSPLTALVHFWPVAAWGPLVEGLNLAAVPPAIAVDLWSLAFGYISPTSRETALNALAAGGLSATALVPAYAGMSGTLHNRRPEADDPIALKVMRRLMLDHLRPDPTPLDIQRFEGLIDAWTTCGFRFDAPAVVAGLPKLLAPTGPARDLWTHLETRWVRRELERVRTLQDNAPGPARRM